jgi:hypothetical protein
VTIAKTITDDMIASTNPIVAMRLGEKYADKLISHDFFIKHTILHEIGHTKGLSEEESDSFAFNEINKVGET